MQEWKINGLEANCPVLKAASVKSILTEARAEIEAASEGLTATNAGLGGAIDGLNTHILDLDAHPQAVVTAALTAIVAELTELRTQYNAHLANETSHTAADATNVKDEVVVDLTGLPATASVVAALTAIVDELTEMRTQYNAHLANAVAHAEADATNVKDAIDVDLTGLPA